MCLFFIKCRIVTLSGVYLNLKAPCLYNEYKVSGVCLLYLILSIIRLHDFNILYILLSIIILLDSIISLYTESSGNFINTSIYVDSAESVNIL